MPNWVAGSFSPEAAPSPLSVSFGFVASCGLVLWLHATCLAITPPAGPSAGPGMLSTEAPSLPSAPRSGEEAAAPRGRPCPRPVVIRPGVTPQGSLSRSNQCRRGTTRSAHVPWQGTVGLRYSQPPACWGRGAPRS